MEDEIVEISPEPMRLRYRRLALPFPVQDYEGVVEVSSLGAGRCRLRWTVSFIAAKEAREKVVALARSIISDGVEGLERDLR